VLNSRRKSAFVDISVEENVEQLTDAWTGEKFPLQHHQLHVRVEALSGRIFAIEKQQE
jgi:hypothetical protein